MTAALALEARHSQQQALSPRLQRAVKLLQLSTAEFSQALDSLLDENPFLETEAELPVAAPAAAAELEPPALWGSSAADWRSGARSAEGELNLLDLVAAPTSLQDHLHAQLRMLRLPDREFLLASVLVESLEDDGYLRLALAEVGGLAELQPAASADELEAALRRVQSLDPPGVGARDLAECLRLQLPADDPDVDHALCTTLLQCHAERLVKMDLVRLARELACPADRLRRAVEQLRRLDPHPGWRYGLQPTRYVTPDILVRKTRTGWSAVLNDAIVPKIRLNRHYADMFRRHRRPENGEMTAQLSEARWALRNVEQRFSTILSVARSILARQHRFLEYGPMAMRPLGLREIAEEVGVHESTVSRVTNNKYMATPCGTYELKYFFSRAMNAEGNRPCSPIAVRGLVGAIIEGEQPSHPLSDVAIAEQLHRQGIQVARRTVTKYRQLLGFKPAEQRGA